LIHHSNQPQSFGDFPHGRLHQPNTKLTCSYYHYRSKGTSSSLPRWRRGAVHRERPIVRSQTGKAQAVPFAFPSPTPTPRQSERTTSLQSNNDNGTPATWTLVLFQQAIDRQDRTPAEGRFSSWNHWRHSLHRTLSHYNRTRTRRNDDMPCRATHH